MLGEEASLIGTFWTLDVQGTDRSRPGRCRPSRAAISISGCRRVSSVEPLGLADPRLACGFGPGDLAVDDSDEHCLLGPR